ncbi:MAG: stage II sporulation protein M [Acidimicrobiia bacterium]
MDIDRYIAQNQPAWERLEALTATARSGRLPAEGVQELVALYQRTSSHLSHARNAYRDPALTARLTGLVARAAAVVYGGRGRSGGGLGRFFGTTFPAAVWHLRRFVVVSAALLLVPAVAVGAWIGTSDAALEASAPAAVREAYVAEDFESYYSSEPAGQFATEVTVNNIQVSILAFAAGILLCGVTAVILAFNGANVGLAGGMFVAAGQPGRFFGLILPHGLLELSAVIVAGAAGLALGWAVVAPGDRTRSRAVTEEGRRAAVVVLGLILAFVNAGIIEGFVTGSGLPTVLRVGVGVATLAMWTTWLVTCGRRAAAQGYTGALGEAARLERARRLGLDPVLAGA